MTSGRFTVVGPMIVLTALNGSLPALLQLSFHQPEADRDHAAAQMAEMLLPMLGVSADEAVTSPGGPFPLRREDDVLSADDAASHLDGRVAGAAEHGVLAVGGRVFDQAGDVAATRGAEACRGDQECAGGHVRP